MGTKHGIDKIPQKVSHQKGSLLCHPSCKGVLRTTSRSERGAYLFYAVLIREVFKNIFIVIFTLECVENSIDADKL